MTTTTTTTKWKVVLVAIVEILRWVRSSQAECIGFDYLSVSPRWRRQEEDSHATAWEFSARALTRSLTLSLSHTHTHTHTPPSSFWYLCRIVSYTYILEICACMRVCVYMWYLNSQLVGLVRVSCRRKPRSELLVSEDIVLRNRTTILRRVRASYATSRGSTTTKTTRNTTTNTTTTTLMTHGSTTQ